MLNALTFTLETKHPGLTGRPFIETPGRLTLLPRFFAMQRPDQVLTSSLLSGPNRRYYESIVEKLELEGKKCTKDKLVSTGHIVDTTPKLLREKQAPLTPDLVAAHPDEGIIVIIEYKHATIPRGAAAVCNRIRELTKWHRRCGDYYAAASTRNCSRVCAVGVTGVPS